MGIFDDLFGGLFDLDGDGTTDAGEGFIAYNVVMGEKDGEDPKADSRPSCRGGLSS